MAIKRITREEANLTSWCLSQVQNVEITTGKTVQSLKLEYVDGSVGVELIYAPDPVTTTETQSS